MGGHFGNIVLILQEKSKKADIKTKSKKYIFIQTSFKYAFSFPKCIQNSSLFQTPQAKFQHTLFFF